MWRDGSLASDVRYGARLLARQRGFSAVAMLTMALAIGVTATLFSVCDAVLWRPLPWPRADRLVRFTETHAGGTRETPLAVTNSTYLMFASLATVERSSAWSSSTVTIGIGDRLERVASAAITPGAFAMLGRRPLAGRDFSSDDAPEVVISYGLWTTRLSAASDAVGRPLTVNGQARTIVGIMPAGFDFPNRDTSVWRPLRVPPPPSLAIVETMARLRDGATPAQAADEATARARAATVSTNALLAVYGSSEPARIVADPALEALTHDVRAGIVALVVAGLLLFAMAIANLASLELARATTRYRELAIRSALGAGPGRVVQHLVIEQLLLALGGGGLGLTLTLALHRALPTLLPADFPRLHEIALGTPAVFVAFALAAATGVVLGALPAWQLRRMRLTDALGDGAAGSIGGARTRARTWIMTGQVAITATLLIVALLLGRSFVAMMAHDRGFEPVHLLTARLTLPDYAFTPAARIEAIEQFVARARELPGAPIAAVTTGMPLSGSENITGFDMPSVRQPVGIAIHVHAVRSVVTPEFVRALGLRLIAGRDFRADDDSPSAPRVVLVNRTFAREYLTERAIGDRIRNFMTDDGVGFEVVGVVGDMQRRGLNERLQPEIYSLLRQSTRPASGQDVVLRTQAGAAPLDSLRRLVQGVAPLATIDSVRTMDDRIRGSLARPRLYAVLLLVFAGSALVIAAVGMVGVLSYTVAQRAREIALRVALGANRGRILALVLAQGLIVSVAGITMGVAAAYAASRYLATLLYGVSPHDAVSFAATALMLAAVALAACTAPGVRAMRIDPLTQLRGQ